MVVVCGYSEACSVVQCEYFDTISHHESFGSDRIWRSSWPGGPTLRGILIHYAECPHTTSNHPNISAGSSLGHQPPPPLRKPTG